MKLQFVTREPDVCQLIASYLSDETISCTVKDNVLDFYIALEDEKLQCDLLVLDFRQFQHMLCNVSTVLRRLKQPIPFIFYNDPYPEADNRVMYWIHQNESLYSEQEFHHFAPLFTALNDIIEHPQVRPHISLLQPPLPIAMREEPEAPPIDLLQFQVRNKIPPTLFSLFEFFYTNMCKELSVKEISRQMFGSGFPHAIRRNCVYSYVSRLKKYIKSDPVIKFDIIRSSPERYKMVVGV